MVYHEHSLNLEPQHMTKMSKGMTVTLKPHHMEHGPHKIHLTMQQVNRMHKAKAENKGMRLKMSNAQLRHNRLHGSGFFDTIKGLAKTAINSDVGKSLINKGKEAGLNLLNKGIDKAAGYVQDKTGFDTSGIAGMAKNAASNIADKTLAKVSEHLNGSGTVSSVLGSIPIIGSFLGPIASMFGGSISPAKAHSIAKAAVHAHLKDGKSVRHHLTHRIHKHLAGSGRRRTVKHGGSFLL